jgi:hypothetical protein
MSRAKVWLVGAQICLNKILAAYANLGESCQLFSSSLQNLCQLFDKYDVKESLANSCQILAGHAMAWTKYTLNKASEAQQWASRFCCRLFYPKVLQNHVAYS